MFHTDHLFQVVDGGLTELGVPGTITDEQTIKFYKQQQRKDAKVMELCAVKAGHFSKQLSFQFVGPALSSG